MATKVYSLYQMAREGNIFSLDGKKLIRTGVKISPEMAEQFNQNSITSGKHYELDEAETERLFGQPVNKEVVKTSNIEETPEQIKYNKRKAAMLEAGFSLEAQDNDGDVMIFRKGEVHILAEELVNMAPNKYGKLLKS